MKVFVTGATGFIGSAIVKELLNSGHDVIGLARSEASAKKLKDAGSRVQLGSISDLESLRRGASEADGVIHTAFYHAIDQIPFAQRMQVLLGGSPTGIVGRFLTTAAEADRRALDTLGRALRGKDRPLVGTFATLAMKPGRLAKESDAVDPTSAGGRRGGNESTMRELAALGVRSSIVRLPPLVHGSGDRGGFAPQLIQMARKKGASAYVGNGQNRWPAVHLLDVAQLFRLALEKGVAGTAYHGSAEEGIPFRDIADVIGQRVGVSTLNKPAAHFGFLAPFVPADNPTSSKVTQAQLGWNPSQPTLMEDLRGSTYFAS